MHVSGPSHWISARAAAEVQSPVSSAVGSPGAGAPEGDLTLPCEELDSSMGFRQAHFLIHPATAEEFRMPLEELLASLPQGPLQSVSEVGYQIHVIDQSGLHPCTLDFSSRSPQGWMRDPRRLEVDPTMSLVGFLEGEGAQDSLLQQCYLEHLVQLNPDRDWDLSAVDAVLGCTSLVAPLFRYYRGQPIHWEAHEFVTLPRRSFVAAMVLNQPIAGIEGPDRKVVFWDLLFRRHPELQRWYILHELGHCFDYSAAFLDPRWRRNWQERLKQNWAEQSASGPITRYCRESVEEYFAESFAAWGSQERPSCTPEFWEAANDLERQRLQLDQSQVIERDPLVVELIEELLDKLDCS